MTASRYCSPFRSKSVHLVITTGRLSVAHLNESPKSSKVLRGLKVHPSGPGPLPWVSTPHRGEWVRRTVADHCLTLRRVPRPAPHRFDRKRVGQWFVCPTFQIFQARMIDSIRLDPHFKPAEVTQNDALISADDPPLSCAVVAGVVPVKPLIPFVW